MGCCGTKDGSAVVEECDNYSENLNSLSKLTNSETAIYCRDQIQMRESADVHQHLLPLRASVLIQCWYRRQVANLEIRRLWAWRVLQALEHNANKSECTEIEIMFKNLAHSSFTTDDDLRLPMNESLMIRLLDVMTHGQKKLSTQFISDLIRSASALLERQPNINQIKMEESDDVIICGDIHGNLHAVLQLLRQSGMPSKNRIMIFNGDFVDRGNKSIEVLVVILALLLTFPCYVYVNRGNHEDAAVNEHYGFKKELRYKYQEESEQLLQLCSQLFCRIPVACIINNSILICHGGIAPSTDLKRLQSLDRMKFTSILSPKFDDNNPVDLKDWEQLLNLLWSDPQSDSGCRPNAFRGGGCYFGPDITESFFNRSGIRFIVRSHQCFPEGWQVTHSGHVVTIFSSMDYYGVQSNDGVYMRLECTRAPTSDSKQGDIICMHPIRDFPSNEAIVMAEERKSHPISSIIVPYIGLIARAENKCLNAFEAKSEAVNAALVRLWQRILLYKKDIITAFLKLDNLRQGEISISDWSCVMTEVTNLQLPWRCLRSVLVFTGTSSSMVKYESLFEGVCLKHPMLTGQDQLTSDILLNEEELNSIAQLIDEENTGVIDLNRLHSTLQLAQRTPKTVELLHLVTRLIDRLDVDVVDSFEYVKFFTQFRFIEIKRRL